MNNALDHRAVAQAAADDLLARLELGCASIERMDTARIAAITSSMSAIGDVVASETHLGRVRCLMVEAENGYLVMRAARRDGVGLVVAALVGRQALLGLAMHAVAETARGLVR
jgi:predicted regulator of Ras-like GTPase activity (Roadblock/LC7/MglB family)